MAAGRRLIIVDTSVLIDAFYGNPTWEDWSLTALEQAAAQDQLVINDIIYAELAPGYSQMGELDRVLASTDVKSAPLPKLALFLAGQAFRMYRRRGGPRTTLLPDFLIGAHAMVEDWPLLTRDPDRVRAYFPTVTLIAP